MADGKLSGMVAFVTGSGGGGIGTGIALCLAEHGAAVVVNDLKEELALPTVEQIKSRGGEAMLAIGDVSQTEDVQRMVSEAYNWKGRLDILVNSVGIGGRQPEIEHMPDEEWLRTVEVDLTAPFKMSRAVIPIMRKQRFGRIINIASIAAWRTGFFSGSPYTASKAGMLGLTRHLAVEEGENGITVNAVLPGGTMIPRLSHNEAFIKEGEALLLGRYALPKDHGEAVAFLASREAEYITGVALPVDGATSIFPGSLAAYLEARAKIFASYPSNRK